MNFGSLKTRIQNIIGRAPNDVCYEMVTADINQQLRLRVMETETTVSEAATVALPSDFLDMVSIYRDTSPRTILKRVTPQGVHRRHEASGTPFRYGIEDGQIRLTPAPNGSENLVIRYYAALSDLSADTDENDVLTKYPAIYVYGSLAHHAALIRDQSNAQLWYAAYDKAKAQARADDRKYRSGVGTSAPSVVTD